MNDRLTITPVKTRRDRADWLATPSRVRGGDPAYTPQLLMQEKRRISPRHNPFFSFGEAELFLARRGERLVGRVSAQINRRHLATYADQTGHFGFFDCQNDDHAARSLLDAACAWLADRGMTRVLGPMNFSINEEIGLLVEGFESPAAILMTHSSPWERGLVEQAGFEKAIDVLAWRMRPAEARPALDRIASLAGNSNRVSARPFNMRDYRSEVRLLIDIFNDAWSDNWGFVPFSDIEIDALVVEMRPFFRGRYGRFVCLDGEPVGAMLILPNVNEAIRGFDGRLAPWNWARLLRDLWGERIRSARIPLLGIRKAHRHTPLSAAMIALLVSEFLAENSKNPLNWIEFSWILESNRPMASLARLVAGDPVKRYRVFSKALAPALAQN